ncbi:hypothetical protein PFISCL1PPCAC_28713, partial [Pristionchus fissidentatus]
FDLRSRDRSAADTLNFVIDDYSGVTSIGVTLRLLNPSTTSSLSTSPLSYLILSVNSSVSSSKEAE